MDYRKTVELNGDPTRGLEVLRMVLASRHFRITSSGAREFEAEGEGINSSEDSLRAISHARVSLSGNSLTFEAEFGTLRRFARGMAIFMGVLAILYVTVFGLLDFFNAWHEGARPSNVVQILIFVVGFPPWLFVLPLLTRLFRNSAVKEVETMLNQISGQA